MTRSALAVVALALVVLTAGCASDSGATPTPDGQTDVGVSVENAGDTRFAAELSLVPDRLSQVNVAYANGVSRPVTNLSSVRGVSAFAPRNATDVRLPPGVEARSSSRFELEPGDRAETRLSAPVDDATLLVVVRQGDRVVAWATAYCGAGNALDRVDVRARGGDPGGFGGVGLSCTRR